MKNLVLLLLCFTTVISYAGEACDSISPILAGQVSQLRYDELDKLNEIDIQWSQHCNGSEPHLRFGLLLDLLQGRFDDGYYEQFRDEWVALLWDRREASQAPDPDKMFRSNPERFGFVPLNSNFDSWTRNLALYLLGQFPEGSWERDFCLNVSGLVLREAEEVRNDTDETPGCIALEFGQLKGLGPHQLYRQAPFIGLTAGGFVNSRTRIDFNTQFGLARSAAAISFRLDQDYHQRKSKFHFTMGLGITRVMPITSRGTLELGIGVGFGSLDTGVKKPQVDEEEEPGNYSATYFWVPVHTGLFYRVGKVSRVGMKATMHYLPFELDRKVVSRISPYCLGISLSYQFLLI